MNPTLTDRASSDRPPLDPRLLGDLPAPWREIEILEQTSSTNGLLAAHAQAGAEPGLVVVTEHQTAGRGRLGRSWETPPRAALTFSVLVQPVEVPEHRWPWLTLLAGVAVAGALAGAGPIDPRLKWPNDVLCGGLKVGGLLAERVGTPAGPAVVVGVGVNVSTTREELPVEAATSLALAGATDLDRTALLVRVLEELGGRYTRWVADGGDPAAGLAEAYRRWCATLGEPVHVDLPSGEAAEGLARTVDDDGALLVETAGGTVAVSAGDVVHVRPGDGPR